MIYDTKLIQQSLNEKGFRGCNGKPLLVDGRRGPQTSCAIIAFKKSIRLKATDNVGPITYARLTGDSSQIALPEPYEDPPWYREALKMLGKHEVRDHAELSLWLKSDGSTVGDPAKIAYCGDGVETAFRLTVSGILVPRNPYLAANWASWGEAVEPQRGCVLSFWRESPQSWKGHVGFYAGESKSNFYVLGFNQSNAVTIAPLAKSRLRANGSRWPYPMIGVPAPTGRKVIMSGGVISTNEA